MTGIIKTDQLQGAQGTTVTVPTGNTLAVTSNATVGGTLGVTGNTTMTSITVGDGHTIGNQSVSDNLEIKSSSGENIVYNSENGAHIFYKNGVENFRVNDDGEVRVTDNIRFTASSKGIYLGVTSATASNLLDDYEEGSWTPSVAGNTTYNNQRGRYVKVGSQVNLWFYIQINQRNSPGVPYIVGGSPFTNSSQVAGSGLVHYFQSIQNSAVVLTCRIDTGGANINVSGATGSSTTIANVNHDWVGNGSEVYGFVTHYVGS